MKRFYFKVTLPTILTILLFILTIFFIIIPSFERNIMNGKREMIKELTNSASSILAKYENDERQGLLTREEAQRTAISRIEYLRYGEENKDYFWITDLVPIMIVHPHRTDLNGKNLADFADPHGKKMFVEFVNTVKNSGHGYVDYMWQWKDDSLKIVPKLSYVTLFEPWNWVIGTGVYIEDVKKEISAITRKLLWISTGISVLIAIMLSYILKQSFNIESKRIEAENNLNLSKEKYKTLVEAATEGLLMLVEGKISFANSVISKLTGFETNELINLSLNEMISPNNNKDIINLFLKNSVIKEGQFELNIKKKSGGSLEVLVTSSTALFYGQTVNIIIIKDISVDRNLNHSTLDYQKLIGILDFGFFKLRIDSGKFIYANETAIRILGFENFNELSEINILRSFIDDDDRKNLKKTILSDGFIKNKILKIKNKNNEYSIVSVSLVLLSGENPENIICDGIIEDITLKENEIIQTQNLIAELKASQFLIEQPINDFLIPYHSIDSDCTINDAVEVLLKRKTDCLLLTKNGYDNIGIVTSSDIQKRVLSLKLNLDNPAYLIMSSPIVYAEIQTSVADAISLCEEKSINHLVVKDGTNKINGVFSTKLAYNSITDSLSIFSVKIKNSETNNELKQIYKSFQLFVKNLIYSDITIKHIIKLTASFSDLVLKRIIELSIKELGQPPVSFSFICLGSEGRKEESLFTDQDNAIIFEDVPVDKQPIVGEYFIKLGNKVCNSLNDIGYSYCKGNIMAKNAVWNKPISIWKKYFTNWIMTPEAQNLLDATIFFDYRTIYGDEGFADELRQTIHLLIERQSVFLYHLAFNAFNTKNQQISSSVLTDKNQNLIDLKGSINQIIMFARIYSLQNKVSVTNTIERIETLKSKEIISENTADELIFVYNFLMKLRFRNQIELLENNLPLSNILNTKNLMEIEISFLKKVLSKIPVFQNKISNDFRLKT